MIAANIWPDLVPYYTDPGVDRAMVNGTTQEGWQPRRPGRLDAIAGGQVLQLPGATQSSEACRPGRRIDVADQQQAASGIVLLRLWAASASNSTC